MQNMKFMGNHKIFVHNTSLIMKNDGIILFRLVWIITIDAHLVSNLYQI